MAGGGAKGTAWKASAVAPTEESGAEVAKKTESLCLLSPLVIPHLSALSEESGAGESVCRSRRVTYSSHTEPEEARDQSQPHDLRSPLPIMLLKEELEEFGGGFNGDDGDGYCREDEEWDVPSLRWKRTTRRRSSRPGFCGSPPSPFRPTPLWMRRPSEKSWHASWPDARHWYRGGPYSNHAEPR